jgi:hypothetical protein
VVEVYRELVTVSYSMQGEPAAFLWDVHEATIQPGLRPGLFLADGRVEVRPAILGTNRLSPNGTYMTISVIATVAAPPIRVAICANGINSKRRAALSMATSPVPPIAARVMMTMAPSTGLSPHPIDMK